MSDDHQKPPNVFGERIWQLPPLILHPFTNELGPAQLLQGSKAALMLAGLLPTLFLIQPFTRRISESARVSPLNR